MSRESSSKFSSVRTFSTASVSELPIKRDSWKIFLTYVIQVTGSNKYSAASDPMKTINRLRENVLAAEQVEIYRLSINESPWSVVAG